jgi:hypothetical protein
MFIIPHTNQFPGLNRAYSSVSIFSLTAAKLSSNSSAISAGSGPGASSVPAS